MRYWQCNCPDIAKCDPGHVHHQADGTSAEYVAHSLARYA